MNVSANGSSNFVIQVQNLSKLYGRVTAVTDLSFDVYRGEIFGFLGPNGAGKTTTLNILEGLQKADGGQVTLHIKQPNLEDVFLNLTGHAIRA